MRRDLYAPVQRFEPITDDDGTTRYYVLFDMHPRKQFTGPKFACLKQWMVPDERIEGEVLAWANAVWHLKDRLYQLAKSINHSVDLDAYANAHPHLLVCADLANMKKHGRNENRSTLNPHLGPIQFDTSKNGSAEFYYDGAMKDKELIVSNPVPIPFRVDVLIGETDNVLGDALDVINNGLLDWFPVIKDLAVLQGDNPEAKALRIILFDENEPATDK